MATQPHPKKTDDPVPYIQRPGTPPLEEPTLRSILLPLAIPAAVLTYLLTYIPLYSLYYSSTGDTANIACVFTTYPTIFLLMLVLWWVVKYGGMKIGALGVVGVIGFLWVASMICEFEKTLRGELDDIKRMLEGIGGPALQMAR